jgi:ribosome biogenesis protein YTM1
MIFNLAQGMVVSVRWCPGDEHKLVSCSYDGTLKLWDTRGRLPLHTVSAHEGERAMGVLFTGTDGRLRLFKLEDSLTE